MFNDPLSKTDCVDLVHRLARCAFPFQCAHGRPSMAPLLDLGGPAGRQTDVGVETGSFARALKKFMTGATEISNY
jgi:hypothetical protein